MSKRKKKPSIPSSVRPSSKFGRVLLCSGPPSRANLGPSSNPSVSGLPDPSSLNPPSPRESMETLLVASDSCCVVDLSGSANIHLPSETPVEAKSSHSKLPEATMATSSTQISACETSSAGFEPVIRGDLVEATVCEISSTVGKTSLPESSLGAPVCENSSAYIENLQQP